MCGIIGYVGFQAAVPFVIDGLRRLEYRGYDSAGVASLESDPATMHIVRAEGKLAALEQRLRGHTLQGTVGMGHTRWATHGRPSDENAHPHRYGSVAVVHNGIIENHMALRKQLRAAGHVFESETDSEILAHLIDLALRQQTKPDLLAATLSALSQVHGAYAIVVLSEKTPHEIVCAKNSSPLIVGFGEKENFLASDLPALLPHTRRVLFLEEGDVARLTSNSVEVFDLSGAPQQRPIKEIHWSVATAEKEGFKHFMLKEIHEQTRALTDTLRGRIQHDPIDINLDGFHWDNLPKRIFLLACGTSYHAGLIGAYWLEQIAKVPARAELASEFRYRDPVIGPGDVVIALSQSGETLDTLEAIRKAKAQGATVLALVNVVGSAISRMADFTLYTHAGPEIGVASTKAFTTQLAALLLVTLSLAKENRALSDRDFNAAIDELLALPQKMHDTVATNVALIQRHAKQCVHEQHMLFLGRGVQYPIALEGALKLKEISYIHAEGYAAGEIKHGTMALIDENMPIVVLAVQDGWYEKVASNLSEVKARGGRVLAIATEGDTTISSIADDVLFVPPTLPAFYPLLTVLPMQLLAYYTADFKGTDVDQPRNLAKSVTVE